MPIMGYWVATALLLVAVSAQIRPSPSERTTPMIREIFLGRCATQSIENEVANGDTVRLYCEHLWGLFKNATAVVPNGTETQDLLKNHTWENGTVAARYAPFIANATWSTPNNSVLLYSGVEKRPLAWEFVSENLASSDSIWTLERTTAGFAVNDLKWCGSSTNGEYNYTGCPDWIENGNNGGPSMFWALASKAFARNAVGRVRVLTMARGPTLPAYRPDSYFGLYELPNLRPGVVTSFEVLLVPNSEVPLEQCGSGSLLGLKQDAQQHLGLEDSLMRCVQDPVEIHHLACVANPSTTICAAVEKLLQNGDTNKDTIIGLGVTVGVLGLACIGLLTVLYMWMVKKKRLADTYQLSTGGKDDDGCHGEFV
eukprot:TRINITY_DN23885_c0_g1_i1.p1 TRINITY_DN23885_c0_g1~~TRINITY_DN23885_c0_g1_i1.p1  ORF type:complete len:369 (-),score=79.42 TRINITY_DN23885_c0_g1_i1:278-1384(-)